MKHFVIFALDTFGDLTLRQSFFKGLLDQGHDVTVLVREPFAPLLPFLDARLKWISTSLNLKTLSYQDTNEVLALKAQIEATKPDALVAAPYFYTDLDEWLMLLFPHLPRFGFDNPALKNVFCIRQPISYLQLKGWRGSFDHLVTGFQGHEHEFEKTKALFKAITHTELLNLPKIILSEAIFAQNQAMLSILGLNPKAYVLAAMGGNTNASIKLLPVESCAQTLAYLTKRYHLPALLTGVKSEETHLLNIKKRCEALGGEAHIWLGEKNTLGTLLYLIQQSQLYYGNDTGAMHMAGAMGIPVLAHFGGGGAYKFLPLAEKSYVVCQDLPCYSCGWRCFAGTPLCINRVSLEALQKGVDWILDPHTQGKILDKGKPLDPKESRLIEKKSKWYQRKMMMKLGLQAIVQTFFSLLQRIK